MKRSTTRWTTALATAALLGLPAGGWAQTPAPTTQPAKSAPAQTPSATSPAQKHLQLAKTAIDSISPTAVTGKSKTQLVEVKKHLAALDRAPAGPAPVGTAGKKTTRATTATTWATDVAAIDRILTSLIGTPATAGATAGAGAANLDEATRGKLAEAQTHIVAFAAAMSGTEPAPATDAAPTAAPDSAAASTAAANTPATSSKGSTAPVDQEAARTQMAEAKATLVELTKLPAAGQLTGETRAQVTQVIANFNELITTTHDWRVSFAKVEADLNALLGPESTDAQPPAGVATGTTGATATGVVGTSGAAPAATLDPSIRAKLIELRTHLKAYEKAAGGAPKAAAATAATGSAATATLMSRPTGTDPAPASAAAAAPTPEVTPAPAPAPAPAVAPTTAPTPAPAVTPATAPTPTPTATPAAAPEPTPTATPAAAPEPTPAAAPAAAPAEAAAQPAQVPADKLGHDAARRHIEAIEAILNGTVAAGSGTPGTAGTSGTKLPTKLDRAQLEQLRVHVSELKVLMAKQ